MDESFTTAATRSRPPRALIGIGVGLLVAGALYLYAVRGAAIFLDLPGLLAAMLCM